MSRFTEALSETADRLTVPQSVRSRILLEVAADMDDLYKAYTDRGLEGEAAREAVLEHFDLSDEALEDLVRVHASPIQGVLNGLSGQPGQGWEKTVLAGLVIGVLAALYGLVSQNGLLGAASAFVWPVMAVTVVAVGLADSGREGSNRAGPWPPLRGGNDSGNGRHRAAPWVEWGLGGAVPGGAADPGRAPGYPLAPGPVARDGFGHPDPHSGDGAHHGPCLVRGGWTSGQGGAGPFRPIARIMRPSIGGTVHILTHPH